MQAEAFKAGSVKPLNTCFKAHFCDLHCGPQGSTVLPQRSPTELSSLDKVRGTLKQAIASAWSQVEQPLCSLQSDKMLLSFTPQQAVMLSFAPRQAAIAAWCCLISCTVNEQDAVKRGVAQARQGNYEEAHAAYRLAVCVPASAS